MDRAIAAGGFPDIADVRLATMHPELLHARQGDVGVSFFRPDLDAPIQDTRAVHPTYGQGWMGKYLGRFANMLPPELLFPDFFADRIAKGGASAKRHNIINALRTTPGIAEEMTEPKVTRIVNALRGFAKGEGGSFDPEKIMSKLKAISAKDQPSPEVRSDPTSHILLNENQARSRFARFDPRLAHLANLLAGFGGVAMLNPEGEQ